MNVKTGSLLYAQSDFSGGLITQFDATKTPRNSYPLAIDAQMRRNVVKPRNRHAKQVVPPGTKNGLYAVGSQLFLFSNGVAYTRDVSTDSTFREVSNWAPDINPTLRVYAERIPVTFNLFNRRATSVETTTLAFNASLAPYPECLWVGNGSDPEQVIYPDGTAEVIGDFDGWTQDNPSYVPPGTVRVFTADKGFLSDPFGLKLYSSVTGRPTDYVIHIDSAGNKVSDANSFYSAVSAEKLTSLKAADNGSVVATTAFGTFLVVPDYTYTFYGEPFLRVKPLFPVGAVNDKSFVNLNGDVAFISFTGIHTFNQTKQDRIESSNEPLGRKIFGLLDNPQTDTCAVDFDDNALFAVNTIYGRGVMVYDNSLEQFTSLDLSFGHVTQFAVVNDPEQGPRLFFINAADELYEAYADDTKLAGRIYLGDFTAAGAGIDSRIDSVILTFTNINAGGQVRCSLWIDGQKRGEQVQELEAADLPASNNAIPRADVTSTEQLQFNFSGRNDGSRIGIWVEWDADAELSHASFYGESSPQRQVAGTVIEEPYVSMWFSSAVTGETAADSGTEVAVVKGAPYAFVPGAGEVLTTGNIRIAKPGWFTAPGDYVQVTPGTEFALVDFSPLIDRFGTADTKTILFSLDQFFNTEQPDAAALAKAYIAADLAIERLRFRDFHILAGTTEYTNPADFFKWSRTSKYFSLEPIADVAVFNYDPGLDYLASQTIDSSGIVSDPSKNIDGYDADSIQARELAMKIAASNARYKIVVCPLPGYLEEGTEDVGRGYHDLRHIGTGASIVITGKNWNVEVQTYYRETVDGVIWCAVSDPSVLKMTASGLGLHCEVYTDGTLVDVFDIVKPS